MTARGAILVALASLAMVGLGCSASPGAVPVSGSADEEASSAVAAPPAADAPPGGLHERAYYEDLARAAGVDLDAGPVVVGVRGVDVNGNAHATNTHVAFDDLVAVLGGDDALTEIAASTHPWFTSSSAAPDVDGDGVPDVGMLRPGHFHVVPRAASRDLAGAPTFHVLTPGGSDKLPAWRDTNHDGVYDASEKAASEARGDTMDAVLFHQGGAPAPAPIGCQVFAGKDIARLVSAVGGRVAFEYVLVEP